MVFRHLWAAPARLVSLRISLLQQVDEEIFSWLARRPGTFNVHFDWFIIALNVDGSIKWARGYIDWVLLIFRAIDKGSESSLISLLGFGLALFQILLSDRLGLWEVRLESAFLDLILLLLLDSFFMSINWFFEFPFAQLIQSLEDLIRIMRLEHRSSPLISQILT